MGGDPTREPPFFFQKPADAAHTLDPDRIHPHAYPPLTSNYHPEIELVVALHAGGRDIDPGDALALVFGYAVGLDMTRRDRQQEMKDGRRPWEIGKSFDRSAPLGLLVPAAQADHLDKRAICLAVNDSVRQRDDIASMIWSVADQIAQLSRGNELKGGDLVFTGTPAGVGPVARGDVLHARIDGLPDLRLRIT